MVGTDFLVPASIGKIILPGGSGEQGNIGVYIPLFPTNHQEVMGSHSRSNSSCPKGCIV